MNYAGLKGSMLSLLGFAMLEIANHYISLSLAIYLSVALSCAITGHFVYVNRINGVSFANFFFLGSFIFFPAAVILLLTLPDPVLSIEQEYWDAVPRVLQLYVFSLIAFWVGYLHFAKRASSRSFEQYTNFPLPTFRVNFLLVSSVAIYVFVGIKSGTYFHIATSGEFNSGFVESFGFFQYFVFLGNVGVAFQLIRAIRYKTRKEMWGFVILLSLMLAFLFPSGSRRPVVFLVALVMYFFMWSQQSVLVRVRLGLISLVAIFLMLPLMETFRLVAGSTGGLFEKLSALLNIIATLNFGENDQYSGLLLATIVAARRISDFCSVAHIMSFYDTSAYRSIADIAEGLLYALPNGLRPPISLSMIYDAELMRDIGFRMHSPGSAPMMFLGDAYSFGGYVSVAAIFFIFGILFGLADRFICRPSQLSLFVFIFLLDQALSLPAYSVVKVYIFFSRQILIAILIYLIIRLFIKEKRCVNVVTLASAQRGVM